jgi:hypothetical protein
MAAPVIPPIRLGLIGTGLAVEQLHWPTSLANRFVVTAFTDISAEQSRRFAGHSGIGPARAAVFLALAASHSTFVLTGGAIGNYPASYPEIPVPPDSSDMRLYGTEGVLVLAGSSSEGRVTYSGSDATTHTNAMVVQRALGSAERAAELALDPLPGAGPVPLRRPRGSTGLFDGLPGQRISSSATVVA